MSPNHVSPLPDSQEFRPYQVGIRDTSRAFSRASMALIGPSHNSILLSFNSSIEQHVGSWCFDIRFSNRWNMGIIKMIPSVVINQLPIKRTHQLFASIQWTYSQPRPYDPLGRDSVQYSHYSILTAPDFLLSQEEYILVSNYNIQQENKTK